MYGGGFVDQSSGHIAGTRVTIFNTGSNVKAAWCRVRTPGKFSSAAAAPTWTSSRRPAVPTRASSSFRIVDPPDAADAATVAARSTRRRLGGDGGQSLVEFAVASTVFFATVFGRFSFGVAVYRYNLIADLAQEGARRASVCGTKKVLGGTDCNVASYVSSRAVGLAVTTVITPIDLSALSEGDSVTVCVQDTFRPLSGFVPGATMTLRSTATMIVAQ